MKPNIKLGEAETPDGKSIALYEHDGSYCIRMGNEQLMHSRSSTSELMLGDCATEKLSGIAAPSVLIGGLGLGFTLKSVLDSLGPQAEVHVSELIPAIVEWNHEHLQGLNGVLLNDPRVTVLMQDAFDLMKDAEAGSYDAILLDTDNGPTPMVQEANSRLYTTNGIKTAKRALKSRGILAVWSASEDRSYVGRLSNEQFSVKGIPCKKHERGKRDVHMIYLAQKLK